MAYPSYAILLQEGNGFAIAYGLTGSGQGDAIDAYRHAYAAAATKQYLVDTLGMSQQDAAKDTNAMGALAELAKGNNYQQTEFGDFNQDFWNDGKGTLYDTSGPQTPAEYVKTLYDGDQLIESNVTVRRQNIWRRSRRKLAECGPRLGYGFRRRACGVASADVRWSVA
mgnify:CR=1 FL=1